MSWHMQLLEKVGVEIRGRFNASVAIERTIGTLLPTIQRNLAITTRSKLYYQRMSYSSLESSSSCLSGYGWFFFFC